MKKKIVFLCGIGLMLSVFSTGCGSGKTGNDAAVATVQPAAGESDDLTQSAEPAATEQGLDENDRTSDDTDDAASAGMASEKPDGTNGGDVTDNNNVSLDQNDGSASNSSGKKISEDEAIRIALDKVKGAKKSDVSIHSEWDDGKEIYEGSIVYKEREYDFEIDASNGNILDWDEESVYDD